MLDRRVPVHSWAFGDLVGASAAPRLRQDPWWCSRCPWVIHIASNRSSPPMALILVLVRHSRDRQRHFRRRIDRVVAVSISGTASQIDLDDRRRRPAFERSPWQCVACWMFPSRSGGTGFAGRGAAVVEGSCNAASLRREFPGVPMSDLSTCP